MTSSFVDTPGVMPFHGLARPGRGRGGGNIFETLHHYRLRYEEVMAKWLLLVVSIAASAALGYGYLGPESCQGCHPDAYAAWRASAHSRAKETLSAPQQKDARCLSCHSPAQAEQQVSNVTCESCHGGGQ